MPYDDAMLPLARRARAGHWQALGDPERAAAEPSPASLHAWVETVKAVLDMVADPLADGDVRVKVRVRDEVIECRTHVPHLDVMRDVIVGPVMRAEVAHVARQVRNSIAERIGS